MWLYNKEIQLKQYMICLFICVIASLQLACNKSTPCGHEEVCNYLDDDCDNLVDEDFKDANGKYSSIENCGGCGVNCREVFPTALEVGCINIQGEYKCQILSCPLGYHLAGSGACVPETTPLCLPCIDDSDCTLRMENSKCISTADDSKRCFPPCGTNGIDCPRGFLCDTNLKVCFPESGYCACTNDTTGAKFACLVSSPTGQMCAGYQECKLSETGEPVLDDCKSAFEEICDGLDNDCDGSIDEDFMVGGQYVHPQHCGKCNSPCVPPGPHMIATCLPANPPSCNIECEENFVDLDEIPANGCECQYSVGSWPPSRLGVDADCDGEIDDSSIFIFVTPSGNDSGPGTLVFPMRTIPAAIQRARETGKTVLVAWGNYAGPVEMAEGVSLYGGYSPDFSERDTSLYPVVIENINGEPGHPTLICRNISGSTEIGGVTIVGSEPARHGEGATAVYFNNCSSNVKFSGSIVYAARGKDGLEGRSSSDNLSRWGMSSLVELNGENGNPGQNGITTETERCSGMRVPGGRGGENFCPGTGNRLDGGDGGDTICPHTGCVSGQPCANAGCTDFTQNGICDMETVLRLAVPNPPAENGQGPGAGSAGAQTYDAVTNRFSCHFCDDNPTLQREGANGESGSPGNDGNGGNGCTDRMGIFDYDSGTWRSLNGENGSDGTDGGGGGGGTCGSGYDVIEGVTGCGDALGGSGGGGGSGGCGAPGADGGQGGGSSIGIAVVLPSNQAFGPTFTDIHVITQSGGTGGDGGIGASGGTGGAGGEGGQGTFWCTRRGGRGGDGGKGGAGGGGGGGCGGNVSGFHVISSNPSSINYIQAIQRANSVDVLAPAGRGGNGGFSPGNSGTAGLDGTAEAFRLVGP